MNLAVCLKQVPDTTELKLDPETNTLRREGVESVLNPLDEFPLEAALQLRERYGGSVTAFSMGPPQAEQVLRKAVAMGANRAVLLSDKAFAGSDTWSTSLTLAKAMEKDGPFDIILCGKQATDGDTAQVGPGIAAHLDIPQITGVLKIRAVSRPFVEVERQFEYGTAVIKGELPILLAVLKEANEPRLPSLAGRIRALRSECETLDRESLHLDVAETGLAGSPTRVVRIASPKAERAQKRLQGKAERVASELFTIFTSRKMIPAERES